jgi:hypothetical protein
MVEILICILLAPIFFALIAAFADAIFVLIAVGIGFAVLGSIVEEARERPETNIIIGSNGRRYTIDQFRVKLQNAQRAGDAEAVAYFQRRISEAIAATPAWTLIR